MLQSYGKKTENFYKCFIFFSFCVFLALLPIKNIARNLKNKVRVTFQEETY